MLWYAQSPCNRRLRGPQGQSTAVSKGHINLTLNSHRNGNLDVIRAAAICLVLVHHTVALSPIETRWIRDVAIYGQYGVDLFFVLSGWLIGGLYWRERHKFGNVAIGRFWKRRWMRTIPPYAVVLLVSWLVVYVARDQPFDLGYLVFAQNYYERAPFFLVSWSLCVEEHFYLLIPLLLLFFGGFKYRRRNAWVLALAILAGPALRLLTSPLSPSEFGYALTATHLHMSGLILAFFCLNCRGGRA
jgi:peptidoglycan/LPS O-acetylase OafA/YrhL